MSLNEVALWATVLVFLLKIVCFILGYLTIRLGADLLREGVKGGFNFSTELKGLKGGLVSSSPGLLFVLLGVMLIGYAMSINKPFSLSTTASKPTHSTKSLPTDPPHLHTPTTIDSLP